jgi:hypothetical protein
MSDMELLEQVVGAREAVRAGAPSIARSDVLRWMESADLEVLGAVYHTIGDNTYAAKIQPPLRPAEAESFIKRYLGRCLLEDSKGQWSHSRYAAGWDLVGWIVNSWKTKDRDVSALAPWKVWLADMYRRGDQAVRDCLITATLEHLFEQQGMRTAFADWKKDPELRTAYELGAEWVREGGRSPLGGDKRGRRRSHE